MIDLIIQLIGWLGAILVITAYFLVSQKKLSGESSLFQTMNLVAAIAVGVNSAYLKAWPSFGIQVVWGSIALYILIKKKF